jgi:hypothetical protein
MDHIPVLTFDCSGWCNELEISYHRGTYQPRTAEEFHALKKYAVDPPDWDGSDNAEKDALVTEALTLGIVDAEGKVIPPSVVKRMGVPALKNAISVKKNGGPAAPDGQGNG